MQFVKRANVMLYFSLQCYFINNINKKPETMFRVSLLLNNGYLA
jgi:hypothetical protein